jgi:hypothetical protein
VIGCIGMIGIPISVIGFLVAISIRRLKRLSVV